MPPTQKFKLVDVSAEEQTFFLKDFEELLKKHSLYFEPIPQLRRDNMQSPWKIVTEVLLQKKIEVVEVEKTNTTHKSELASVFLKASANLLTLSGRPLLGTTTAFLPIVCPLLVVFFQVHKQHLAYFAQVSQHLIGKAIAHWT